MANLGSTTIFGDLSVSGRIHGAPTHESMIITLGNQFGDQTAKIVRVGDTVTIDASVSHSDISLAQSSNYVIPTHLRPRHWVHNMTLMDENTLVSTKVSISTSGQIRATHYSASYSRKVYWYAHILITYTI